MATSKSKKETIEDEEEEDWTCPICGERTGAMGWECYDCYAEEKERQEKLDNEEEE